jgi:pimeloyl-ACP methyl ester carboxylesterase
MMILLHGALASAAQFDTLRAQLSPDLPVWPINLPGHGGLPAESEFSLDAFATAVLAYCDERQIAHLSLFGYSMGGYVALYLAWKYPERVSKVITLNTKLEWNPTVAAQMQGMMDTAKIIAKAPALAAQFEAYHAPEDWQKVAARTGAFMRDLGEGRGLPEAAFSQINCPVTLLRGEKDKVVSVEECQWAQERLPRGYYREIPESGHLLEQVDLGLLAAELGMRD